MGIYRQYRSNYQRALRSLRLHSVKRMSDGDLKSLTDKIAMAIGDTAKLVKNHIKNIENPRFFDEYRRVSERLGKLITITDEFEKLGDMLTLQNRVQEMLGFNIYYPRTSLWLTDIRMYVDTVSKIAFNMQTNTVPRYPSGVTRVSDSRSSRNDLAYQTVLNNALDDLKNVLLGGKGKGVRSIFHD